MKITLVRHGEPNYAIDSLTPKGFREAELLADRLCQMDVRDFYVSPLGRAQDTARPTLTRLNRTAETLPWLAEFRGQFVDPCSGEMRIPWNLAPRFWTTQPQFYDPQHWRDHPLFQNGTVGEIFDETAEGMDALLAHYGCVRDGGLYRCECNTDDRIVLFCHFAVSMAILAHMLNLSPVALWHGVSLQPTSLTTLITEERRPGEVFFRMMEMGDTSHLYAGGEPVSHQGLYRERFEQPGDAPSK